MYSARRIISGETSLQQNLIPGILLGGGGRMKEEERNLGHAAAVIDD